MKINFILITVMIIIFGTSCSFNRDNILVSNIKEIENGKNDNDRKVYEFGYEDVKNHWCRSYILYMKDLGALSQFSEKKLYPDKEMTRKECTVLISDFFEKAYDYKPNYDIDESKFPDLQKDENGDKIRALSLLTFRSYMSSNYVDYPEVGEAKIIDGFPSEDGIIKFRPNDFVTRAEFAKILLTAIDCFGYLGIGDPGFFNSTDIDDHWSRRYLLYSEGYNILEGYWIYEGRSLTYDELMSLGIETELTREYFPDSPVTRAEAIKMVASARGMKYIGLPMENKGSSRKKDETELYYYRK